MAKTDLLVNLKDALESGILKSVRAFEKSEPSGRIILEMLASGAAVDHEAKKQLRLPDSKTFPKICEGLRINERRRVRIFTGVSPETPAHSTAYHTSKDQQGHKTRFVFANAFPEFITSNHAKFIKASGYQGEITREAIENGRVYIEDERIEVLPYTTTDHTKEFAIDENHGYDLVFDVNAYLQSPRIGELRNTRNEPWSDHDNMRCLFDPLKYAFDEYYNITYFPGSESFRLLAKLLRRTYEGSNPVHPLKLSPYFALDDNVDLAKVNR